MNDVQAALNSAAKRLAQVGITDGARDARRIMAAVLGTDASRVTLVARDALSAADQARFEMLIARRAQREPVSHLVGCRNFYGRMFEVGPDVLDPRPETEELIAAALQVPFQRVLDLGTGSGCIVATLLAERGAGVTGVGTDISAAALVVAGRNLASLNVANQAQLVQGDWCAAIPSGHGPFDLIVSNPPYIAVDEMPGLAPEVRNFEPRQALTDEADGLHAYRKITADGPAHLVPGGWLIAEIGPTQGAQVCAMFKAAGLDACAVLPDIDGRDRVVQGQKPRKSG